MNKSTFNSLKIPNGSVVLGAVKNIIAAANGRRHLALAAIGALFFTLAFPNGALATPPSGVTGTVFARASFVESTGIRFIFGRGHIIQVNHARETVVQQIIIAPGGHTGWHSHPGPVVVLIKSGQMSLYEGEDPTCTARTYSIGQSFVDRGQGHVHIARNEGTENLEVWATYFDVPAGGAIRNDVPDPGNCSF